MSEPELTAGRQRTEGPTRRVGPSREKNRGGRLLGWLLPGAALAGAAMLAIGTLGMVPSGAAEHSDLRDMAGNPVTFEPGVVPDASTIDRMDVDSTPNLRFAAPTVGLDVPLAAMNEVDGTITPPGFEDAYWVRNLGTAPSSPDTGTVFIVMHSLRGGGVAPGNYLIDIDQRTSRLPVGSVIHVGDITYSVSGAEIVPKTMLPNHPAIWNNNPGTLVVITCLQTPDGHASTDNVVVTATKVQRTLPG